MSLHDELTRIARRTMLRQVSATDRLIRQLYIRAARALAEQIKTAKKGSLTERWLIAYKQALEQEIERLSAEITRGIESGARAAAQARTDAEREWLKTVAARAKVDDSFVSVLSHVPTDALRAMMDGKLYTDGRMLSSRVWSAMGKLEGNIAELIQQGVAQQMDALTLARHLEAYVNPEAACPVSWHKLYPDIPFERKIDYNALRLARTSINHVYWAAEKAAARKNPLCKGIKWHLSDAHYERQIAVAGEDVCDEYARHDEGLGRGVYPIERVPFPHPQCLCYRTEVLPTLEESADLLGKWARGEAQNPEIEADFRRWQKENAAELENWYTPAQALKQALDNSGEFATMDTEKIAKAMLSEPVIPDAKIYQFMLKPGAKHHRDFVEAGYTSEADGERLREDILAQCKRASHEDIQYVAEYDYANYVQHISLGAGHCFRVAWKVERNSDAAQLITCYRKEKK